MSNLEKILGEYERKEGYLLNEELRKKLGEIKDLGHKCVALIVWKRAWPNYFHESQLKNEIYDGYLKAEIPDNIRNFFENLLTEEMKRDSSLKNNYEIYIFEHIVFKKLRNIGIKKEELVEEILEKGFSVILKKIEEKIKGNLDIEKLSQIADVVNILRDALEKENIITPIPNFGPSPGDEGKINTWSWNSLKDYVSYLRRDVLKKLIGRILENKFGISIEEFREDALSDFLEEIERGDYKVAAHGLALLLLPEWKENLSFSSEYGDSPWAAVQKKDFSKKIKSLEEFLEGNEEKVKKYSKKYLEKANGNLSEKIMDFIENVQRGGEIRALMINAINYIVKGRSELIYVSNVLEEFLKIGIKFDETLQGNVESFVKKIEDEFSKDLPKIIEENVNLNDKYSFLEDILPLFYGVFVIKCLENKGKNVEDLEERLREKFSTMSHSNFIFWVEKYLENVLKIGKEKAKEVLETLKYLLEKYGLKKYEDAPKRIREEKINEIISLLRIENFIKYEPLDSDNIMREVGDMEKGTGSTNKSTKGKIPRRAIRKRVKSNNQKNKGGTQNILDTLINLEKIILNSASLLGLYRDFIEDDYSREFIEECLPNIRNLLVEYLPKIREVMSTYQKGEEPKSSSVQNSIDKNLSKIAELLVTVQILYEYINIDVKKVEKFIGDGIIQYIHKLDNSTKNSLKQKVKAKLNGYLKGFMKDKKEREETIDEILEAYFE